MLTGGCAVGSVFTTLTFLFTVGLYTFAEVDGPKPNFLLPRIFFGELVDDHSKLKLQLLINQFIHEITQNYFLARSN